MIAVMQALHVCIRAISPVHRGLARSGAIVTVNPRRQRPRWHGLALHLQPRPAAPTRDQVKPVASQTALAATNMSSYVHTRLHLHKMHTHTHHEHTKSLSHTHTHIKLHTHVQTQVPIQTHNTPNHLYTRAHIPIRYMHVHILVHTYKNTHK